MPGCPRLKPQIITVLPNNECHRRTINPEGTIAYEVPGRFPQVSVAVGCALWV